ncbi:rho GTPase-activating protein 7-like [Cocos nucifera]|uniref:Rho GTPase-activating protein 7-like n=1 Tax=Cocos nucifera TaxID=13894 RepID=A0A8K0IY17_COCNU|nr:rho GTPase-activating protein 7-like [Cocos nucifera]
MSSSPASAPPFERHRAVASNAVFKSGPLFISSKGIGWKSWKKRWFILTRTSLVFFKNDPNALPERGGEVNLTLGGIDLNNSGSVVVREDKKLLTVLFPDGRDGRAFTLKAETSEDLFEWKIALEHALALAPNAALVMGHNGIFRNDNADTYEGSMQHCSCFSLVVGRPILLALEDIDGGPSFLEKALCFLEKHGTNVEGILRQSADVEEVDRRVQEYEQGRTEFAADEDAHVVGDCVKHVLRELPSSPVPASCCTALLEAYRLERKEACINAMRSAISETFPEPNRRLLQRILKMMRTIASHTAENRMTPSAVAACMAPLLLRPLLAGECEMDDDFDMNGDSSAQLLAAANAANNAQAIITALLEEYENIFDDNNLDRCSPSDDPQVEDTGSEESTNDGNAGVKDNGYHDAEIDVDPEVHDDPERVLSGKLSESSGYAGSDPYECKARKNQSVESVDSSGEEELAIQRLEITKNDLRIRITKEAKGNAILQASLERRKQALHERRVALEQDVSRLQEQLQAERDLRAALEVGLSMSSGQFSTSRTMDSKTRAELEEIALAEADVARLKQKVAELHLQINQQRQNQYGSLSPAGDRCQLLPTHLAQQKTIQKDFDMSRAFCNHERKQRNEESLSGADWKNVRPQVLPHASSNKLSWRHSLETIASESKGMEASTSISSETTAVVANDAPRITEGMEYQRQPSVASSTLVELTTRLDFFKERRSQLMEQLTSLDLSHGAPSHGSAYKSSPPWNSPS